RFGIEPFGIPLSADFDRTSHIDLDEIADHLPHFIAHGAVRRDRCGDRCYAVARKEVADKADAPDVGVAILFREAEPFTQVGAHDIAVENLDTQSPLAQFFFNNARKSALAGTRKA